MQAALTEIDGGVTLNDTNSDSGICGEEIRQPRDKPLHGEGAKAGDNKLLFGGSAGEPRYDQFEGRREGARQASAGFCKVQLVTGASYKTNPKASLQRPHLAADRAMAHIQFGRRASHRSSARISFESA